MSRTSFKNGLDEQILSLENCSKLLPGFIKLDRERIPKGQFAKVLASAFIKFTAQGQLPSEEDSVQNFLEMAQLHWELTEQARCFLTDAVSFVVEQQQLQPLLLEFAVYRVQQIAHQYTHVEAQSPSSAIMADLKRVLIQRQEDLTRVIVGL